MAVQPDGKLQPGGNVSGRVSELDVYPVILVRLRLQAPEVLGLEWFSRRDLRGFNLKSTQPKLFAEFRLLLRLS